jgi:hypothetical protein
VVGKPEGKRQFVRLGCRWGNNNRMDLREIGWEVVDWMQLAQGRNQWGGGSFEHGNKSSDSIKDVDFD